LDIGGNIGVWGIILAARVPEGKVITFEPQQDMINILGTNILLNNVLNLATVRAFVGNSTGWSSISRVAVREDGAANYGAQSKEMLEQQSHGPSSYRVPNLRLDDEFNSKDGLLGGKCPSFIKMDIEGGELLALIGGRETLRVCQPVLFLEAECKWYYRSLFFFLHSLGYSIAWVVAPIVDISLPPHFERFVTDTYHNLMQLYISRNIIAVPRAFESVLKNSPILAYVDVLAEFESNPDTWFSLDDRTVKICHDASGECFRWAQPQESRKSDPAQNKFYCENSTINPDLVFLYKTL
jgi:FkbM family methyltransferase